MRNFASFVLTKDSVFWLPDDDSHQNIIEHYGLHTDGATGPNIVKVEIIPGPALTRFEDYAKWTLRFDQDVFPEWHDSVESAARARARAALLRRAKDGFKTVYASDCTALTSLDAKAANTVDASGCTALTKTRKGWIL
jgi:hypothetical protein